MFELEVDPGSLSLSLYIYIYTLVCIKNTRWETFGLPCGPIGLRGLFSGTLPQKKLLKNTFAQGGTISFFVWCVSELAQTCTLPKNIYRKNMSPQGAANAIAQASTLPKNIFQKNTCPQGEPLFFVF